MVEKSPLSLFTQFPYTKRLAWLTWYLFIGSSVIIGGALVAQYQFEMYPCKLCIYQRYPYFLVMGLTFILIITGRDKPRLQQGLLWLSVLALLATAGIALYHAGVEQGIFAGPSGCTNTGESPNSIEALRAQLLSAPLVPCDQAMGYVLGLSLAVWNAILALFLAIMSSIILRIKE